MSPLPCRDVLQIAALEGREALFSLIYGADNLVGKYEIPTDTVFRIPSVLEMFFEEVCFGVRN